jgi:hypothetical protein
MTSSSIYHVFLVHRQGRPRDVFGAVALDDEIT